MTRFTESLYLNELGVLSGIPRINKNGRNKMSTSLSPCLSNSVTESQCVGQLTVSDLSLRSETEAPVTISDDVTRTHTCCKIKNTCQ